MIQVKIEISLKMRTMKKQAKIIQRKNSKKLEKNMKIYSKQRKNKNKLLNK